MSLDAVYIMKLCVCVAVGKPILIVQPVSVAPANKDWAFKSWFAVSLDEVLEIEGSGFLYELKIWQGWRKLHLVVRPGKGVVMGVAKLHCK